MRLDAINFTGKGRGPRCLSGRCSPGEIYGTKVHRSSAQVCHAEEGIVVVKKCTEKMVHQLGRATVVI